MSNDIEPAAWLHHHSKLPTQAFMKPLPRGAEELGWTETPLYAHPPRGDQVARVVEWLRKENGLCDCHARCETECGCGAWDDWKTKPLLQIADAIERGEPFRD